MASKLLHSRLTWFAVLAVLVGCGFVVARLPNWRSQSKSEAAGIEASQAESKPQVTTAAQPEAAVESSPQTLILGKWRSASKSLEQVYDFKKEGVVTRTTSLFGTITGKNAAGANGPIDLGSFSQSGKYTFVNDKLIHIALKQGESGGMSAGAQEFDFDLIRITPSEIVNHWKTESGKATEWTLERVN